MFLSGALGASRALVLSAAFVHYFIMWLWDRRGTQKSYWQWRLRSGWLRRSRLHRSGTVSTRTSKPRAALHSTKPHVPLAMETNCKAKGRRLL